MVRAKFKLIGVTEFEGTMKKLTFSAQYDSTIAEDLRFQKATPWGEISMNVDNPLALEQFKIGKYYYLDFTSVE